MALNTIEDPNELKLTRTYKKIADDGQDYFLQNADYQRIFVKVMSTETTPTNDIGAVKLEYGEVITSDMYGGYVYARTDKSEATISLAKG